MNTLIPVNNVYVIVIFLSQVIFVCLLFLGMVIYANENETKRNKNYLREINYNIIYTFFRRKEKEK